MITRVLSILLLLMVAGCATQAPAPASGSGNERRETVKQSVPLPSRGSPPVIAASRGGAARLQDSQSSPATALPVREEAVQPAARSVYFPIGSNEITNAGRRLLQEVADRLKGRPREHVTLMGHTDDAGSAEFNIALAQRRVDTVSSELMSLGVSARQIRRISYGDEAGGGLSCSTEACRQQKRRVELRLSDD